MGAANNLTSNSADPCGDRSAVAIGVNGSLPSGVTAFGSINSDGSVALQVRNTTSASASVSFTVICAAAPPQTTPGRTFNDDGTRYNDHLSGVLPASTDTPVSYQCDAGWKFVGLGFGFGPGGQQHLDEAGIEQVSQEFDSQGMVIVWRNTTDAPVEYLIEPICEKVQ